MHEINSKFQHRGHFVGINHEFETVPTLYFADNNDLFDETFLISHLILHRMSLQMTNIVIDFKLSILKAYILRGLTQ